MTTRARRRKSATGKPAAETAPATVRAPAPGEPIDVALADKNPLVLAALRQMFGADPRFRVVVTATDGERFLDAVDRVPFSIGIIGWLMPYCGGRCVLERLRSHPAPPRVIVYTGSPDPTTVRTAMSLGASGYCSKSRPPEELIATAMAVAQGRMIFPIIDLRRLHEDPLAALTTRERELLAALPEGKSNAQIAHALDVSVNTVKFHLKRLYEKLGVRNRAQAIARYLGQVRE